MLTAYMTLEEGRIVVMDGLGPTRQIGCWTGAKGDVLGIWQHVEYVEQISSSPSFCSMRTSRAPNTARKRSSIRRVY